MSDTNTMPDWRETNETPAKKVKKPREKARRSYFAELQEQKSKANAACRLLERIIKEDSPAVLKALAAVAKETLEG